MPARPVVPDVLKVEFLWSLAGLPAANVKYVQYSGDAPTAGACAAIAEALYTAWWADAGAHLSTGTTFEACRVTDLATDTGAEGSVAPASVGGDATGDTPAGCALLVNHTIGRRYRGGHPRTYYPGLGLAAIASVASWEAAALTAFTAAEAAYALAASTFSESGCDGVYNVNVSYISDHAARVDPVIDQITGSIASGIIRTQRRRYTSSSY